jgi:hypothetical protein
MDAFSSLAIHFLDFIRTIKEIEWYIFFLNQLCKPE